MVNKNNSKLYFVYLPTFDRYKTNFDDTGYNSIKDILNQLDIPLIDIHQEVFDKEIDPLNLFPFQMNGHYNVKGYKKLVKQSISLLRTNLIIFKFIEKMRFCGAPARFEPRTY